jgi:hypothetical protein
MLGGIAVIRTLIGKGRPRRVIVTLLLAILLVGLAGVPGVMGSVVAEAKNNKVKGPKPPKERTVDVVITKKATRLRTADGYVVMDVAPGVTFQLDHHKGNKVWVKGPSGTSYYFPSSDVKIEKGHKASVGNMTESQFQSFGLQVTAARVTAVMQATYSATGTDLPRGRRTEWQDRVLFQMSIQAGIEVPTLSLMIEWASYSGYID